MLRPEILDVTRKQGRSQWGRGAWGGGPQEGHLLKILLYLSGFLRFTIRYEFIPCMIVAYVPKSGAVAVV